MGDTTDGRPAGGIRASDAERDATVERLSRAAGDGRLTLEEFSQRMEQATSAKTRAELDRLTADLPAEPAAAVARAGPASAPASWHVWPVGGLRVSGPWRMARHVIVASIVGGTWLDLTQAQLGRPRGHADHRVAGGPDPDHRPAGDRGPGVGLQPGRRHHGRGRPGAGPRRADRLRPRVLAGRRRHDPAQRATRGPGTARRLARRAGGPARRAPRLAGRPPRRAAIAAGPARILVRLGPAGPNRDAWHPLNPDLGRQLRKYCSPGIYDLFRRVASCGYSHQRH
jgi:Domain of unknown function (DUF1707)